MKYTIIKILFPKHGQYTGKDVTNELTSLTVPASERIPNDFDTLSKTFEAHKTVDPYRNIRKDLVVIVKDNTSEDISIYRFPETEKGNKTVSIVIP